MGHPVPECTNKQTKYNPDPNLSGVVRGSLFYAHLLLPRGVSVTPGADLPAYVHPEPALILLDVLVPLSGRQFNEI